MDKQREGKSYFKQPKFVRDHLMYDEDRGYWRADVWVVFDKAGWFRGAADTEELAERLYDDLDQGRIASPILAPVHYTKEG